MYLLARWMTAKISIRACGMVRLVHVGRDLGGQLVDHGLQLGVDGLGTGHIVHGAAEVLLAHGDRAAEQVAQIVCKVAVDAVDQSFVGEHAIVAEGISRSRK